MNEKRGFPELQTLTEYCCMHSGKELWINACNPCFPTESCIQKVYKWSNRTSSNGRRRGGSSRL